MKIHTKKNRPYWLHALSGDGVDLSHCPKNSVSVGAYDGCCTEIPPSFFQDCTKDVSDFLRNISEYKTETFVRALDPLRLTGSDELNPPKSLFLPDVLCPWGCCKFSFQAKGFDPSLLIQQHLRKVQLNLRKDNHKKMYRVETSRLDYIRIEGEPIDYVLVNANWPILPLMHMIPGKGLVPEGSTSQVGGITKK